MPELWEALGLDRVSAVIEAPDLLQLREPALFDVERPVVRAGHSQRARSDEGADPDVARSDPQVRRVLTFAASLHLCADHDGGEGDADALV